MSGCTIEYDNYIHDDNNNDNNNNNNNVLIEFDYNDYYQYLSMNNNIYGGNRDNNNNYTNVSSRLKCWLINKFFRLVGGFQHAIIITTYFPKLKVFTIFRNPTDRLVSWLHWGNVEKDYKKRKKVLKNKYDLGTTFVLSIFF